MNSSDSNKPSESESVSPVENTSLTPNLKWVYLKKNNRLSQGPIPSPKDSSNNSIPLTSSSSAPRNSTRLQVLVPTSLAVVALIIFAITLGQYFLLIGHPLPLIGESDKDKDTPPRKRNLLTKRYEPADEPKSDIRSGEFKTKDFEGKYIEFGRFHDAKTWDYAAWDRLSELGATTGISRELSNRLLSGYSDKEIIAMVFLGMSSYEGTDAKEFVRARQRIGQMWTWWEEAVAQFKEKHNPNFDAGIPTYGWNLGRNHKAIPPVPGETPEERRKRTRTQRRLIFVAITRKEDKASIEKDFAPQFTAWCLQGNRAYLAIEDYPNQDKPELLIATTSRPPKQLARNLR